MRVSYRITLDVETNDYVDTLGEINDIIQDHLGGDPEIVSVHLVKYRTRRDS